MKYNVIFAGTPDISSKLLQELINHGIKVSACYTQPDRPKGRKQIIEYNSVKQVALKFNIPVIQPKNFKGLEVIEEFKKFKPDLMIVFAYGLILPKTILEIPKLGCFNVHTSLLPRWRGAAPVQHGIINGDPITGISIMKMDEGLDTGDILHTETCKIDPDDTTGSLYQKLQPLATKAILNVLSQLENNKLKYVPQNNQLATYAPKFSKADAKINWQNSASEIERFIRALIPQPVAFTNLEKQAINIRIWQAKVLNNLTAIEYKQIINNTLKEQQLKDRLLAGTIIRVHKHGIDVVVGKDQISKDLDLNLNSNLAKIETLSIEKLQLPGSKILSVAELVNAPKNRELFKVGNKFC